MTFIRSLLFNLLFFGLTAALAIVSIPTIFMSRSTTLRIVRLWLSKTYLLEKYILNLNFEVHGSENLPDNGSYIVAMKHQSAWETLKLLSLFGEPLIILKKELMNIPLWGSFAKKYGVIPIDRSKGRQAMSQMIEDAREAIKSGRPIVIFPQGTRVAPDNLDKSYKFGFAKLYEALDLPIIPIALNSGMFWGRNAFLKKSGTVEVSILPRVDSGLSPEAVHKMVSEQIEEESLRLCKDPKYAVSNVFKKFKTLILALAVILFTLHGVYWLSLKHAITSAIEETTQNPDISITYDELSISGYPLNITAKIDSLSLNQPSTNVAVEAPSAILSSRLFGPPTVDILIPNGLSLSIMGEEQLAIGRAQSSVKLDSISAYLKTELEDLSLPTIKTVTPFEKAVFIAEMTPLPSLPITKKSAREWYDASGKLTLHQLAFQNYDQKLKLAGVATLSSQLQPNFSGTLSLDGAIKTLNNLLEQSAIAEQDRRLIKTLMSGFGLSLFKPTDGSSSDAVLPLTINNGYLFIGPAPVFKIPPITWQ